MDSLEARVPDKILLAGDWHSSFPAAKPVIEHAKNMGINTIIQLGDFGIWSTDKPYLNQMEFLLNQWDIQLYFIDGNHEDFPRLYDKRILDDGTRYVRDHITYIPRGYRWDWNGLSFLALGGAASIDKRHRRVNKSWWAEEYITEEDVLTAQSGGPVDIMFCHDSPSTAPNSVCDSPFDQANAIRYFGADVLNYCSNHRETLARVTNVTTPRLLFHGHYHKYMEGIYVHRDEKNTVGYVYGLDQGLGQVKQNVMVFDFDWAKEKIEKLNNIEY